MAQSRLEKVGTIYSKIRGLLSSGAIKSDQVPLWYDVYEAFPPKYEPRWDRVPSSKPINKILYQEDIVRSRFYEKFGRQEVVNLQEPEKKLLSQIFVDKYIQLGNEGTPADRLWDNTIQALELEGVNLNAGKPDRQQTSPPVEEKQKFSLQNIFEESTK